MSFARGGGISFRKRRDEVAARLGGGVTAKRLDDMRAELTFACGHSVVFEREDGLPLRPSDIGNLMSQTECGEDHEPVRPT